MTPSRDSLNFQADRIERLLAAHRLPGHVHGGAVWPRWVRFLMTPAEGLRFASVKSLSDELALALGTPDVRVDRDGDAITIDVPRQDPESLLLLNVLSEVLPLPPHTACLGLTEQGVPLLLRLPSPDVAHVLVAGHTGSGKTELIRTLVTSLALGNRQSRLQLALIDPKSRGFLPLRGLPHLIDDVVTHVDAALHLLERLLVEIERRDEEGRELPRIVVAIDELGDLLLLGGKPVEHALTRLTQRGRAAGLHIIAGVQKPASNLVSPMLKANFPTRLVGRVTSADDAQVATGAACSNAEKLAGCGDFVAVAAGQTVRFQSAWISAADWPAIHQHWQVGEENR